jgi:hypothetical protein
MSKGEHSGLGAWFIILIGIILLAGGFVMYFVFDIGLIWIGGLVLGITIIFSGAKMLKEISIQNHPSKKYTPPNDLSYMIINCGNCSYPYHEKKGQGMILSECPQCGRKSRVMT